MYQWELKQAEFCFNLLLHMCCLQFDLETIKDLYLEKYDVSLKDALRDECSGDFKRLLLAICH